MGDLIHDVFNHGREDKEKKYEAIETVNADGTINIELPINEMQTDCIRTALRNYVLYLNMPDELRWPQLAEDMAVHKKLLLGCGVITESDEITGKYNGKFDEFYPEYEEYMHDHLLDDWDFGTSVDIAKDRKKGFEWIEQFSETWGLDNDNTDFPEIKAIADKIREARDDPEEER